LEKSFVFNPPLRNQPYQFPSIGKTTIIGFSLLEKLKKIVFLSAGVTKN